MVASLIPRPIFTTPWGTGETTVFLDDYVTGLQWVSHLHGKADELEFHLDNTLGLFTGDYVPLKGDDVSAALGYDAGPLAGLWPIGEFVVDDYEAQGPPDSVVVRALSTSSKMPLRQPNSTTFENQTLVQVLEAVAKAAGLTPKVQAPAVRFEAVMQRGETDLAFATRLAARFGCICKVEGRSLIVHPLETLWAEDAVALIGREDVLRYSIRHKLSQAAHADTVPRYLDPETKELIGRLAGPWRPLIASLPDAPSRKGPRYRTYSPTRADVHKVAERMQDKAHAEAITRARLAQAAMGQIEGNLTVAGDPRLRAGATIALEGFGVNDKFGFIVSEARHHLSRPGAYTTAINFGLNPLGAQGRAALKKKKDAQRRSKK